MTEGMSQIRVWPNSAWRPPLPSPVLLVSATWSSKNGHEFSSLRQSWRGRVRIEDTFPAFHPRLSLSSLETLVSQCGLGKSSLQQSPSKKPPHSLSPCVNSSAVTAFIPGSGQSDPTNAELTASAALTAPQGTTTALALPAAPQLPLHIPTGAGDHP